MNGIVDDTNEGIGICILMWYVFSMTSPIISIVGSSKNNKCLLIPFIICLVLHLLAYIRCGIYYRTQICHAHYSVQLTLFIPLSIGFGITIYFLLIVLQFYKELASRSRLQPEIVLQPCMVWTVDPPKHQRRKIKTY